MIQQSVLLFPKQDVLGREEEEGLLLAGGLPRTGLFAVPPHLRTKTATKQEGRVLPASAGFSQWLLFSGRWVNGDSIHSERIPSRPELICKSPAHRSSCKSHTSSRWGFMTRRESCVDLQHQQRYTAEENEPMPPPWAGWSPCIHFAEMYATSIINERKMEKKEVLKLDQLPGET